jgi:hypothetical protein
MSGCRGVGTIHLIKGRAGFVPVISTISKAGSYAKGTGIATSMDDGDKPALGRWSLVVGYCPWSRTIIGRQLATTDVFTD